MAVYDVYGQLIGDVGGSGESAYNPLKDKIWVAEGDSITKASNTPMAEGYYQSYAYFAAKQTGLSLINRGINGTCLAKNATTNTAFSDYRYKNLPADMDYLTIAFGTNDYIFSTLGSPTDTDENSFYGAWNVVLPYIIEKHPTAHIGIIIPWQTDDAFHDATVWAAETYGIPYLDWKGDPQVPLIASRTSDLHTDATIAARRAIHFLADGIHPGVEGHQILGRVVAEWIKTI